MLFRVHVTVLRANRQGRAATPRNGWHDAVACTFGVNADSAAEAVETAATAAGSAVDRNGQFIGGVVIETACRYVERKEFNGHEKYFHRPIDKRGIFYVSGASQFRLPEAGNADAVASVGKMSRQIRSSGPPTSTFVYPRSPDEPPDRMRLLCSVCKRWMEVEGDELLSVYMASPLDAFTPEEKKVWRSANIVGPFVRRHLAQCLFTAGEPRGAMLAIHEPDPRWDTLDPDKREPEQVG